MKKIVKIYFLPILLLLATSSCKKSFDDLTHNNNLPASVTSPLLLNGILNKMVDLPGTSNEIYSQYFLYNYDYYGNNRYDFGSGDDYYATLKNVLAMEAQAAKESGSALNPYSALGKYFKAYFFSKMSLETGDIPMSQALQGLDNLTPAYDSQKTVMIQCLALLESANSDLTTLIANNDNSLKNDIFYNNSLPAWQKAVNTFRIRLLIELSKRADDNADLKVSSQFAAIISNPAKYPLMTAASDNLQYISVIPNNFYPTNPNDFGNEGSRKNTSATYIGLLTKLNDPRVYVTAEPSRYAVDTLKQSPTDFASFIGADPGLDLGVMYNNAGLQKYSFINRKRYYSTYTGEPVILLGYPELMFNIAEAINRGWINGDAEAYYKSGIKASMDFYGIPSNGSFTAYFYRPGSTDVTKNSNYDNYNIPVNFDTYYSQPTVKYAGGTNGLTEILAQKYISLFRQSGLESYFTYRRTLTPAFTTGPGTGNGSRIAWRFQYPQTEKTANTTNYNKALQSQYGGNDDINGVMWILK